MDKSRQTRKVQLGEIVEIIDNGNKVDAADLNSKLLPNKEPWENSVTTIEYNTDMQLVQALLPIGFGKNLNLWRGEKATCDNDTIKGSFKVMDSCIKDFVPMTISGLSNPVGGFVEIKSDDGKILCKI